MKLPRDLSDQRLVSALTRHWDYKQIQTAGSHIILQTETPSHHRVAIPDHSVLGIGTLNSILRAIARHKNVDRQQILDSL